MRAAVCRRRGLGADADEDVGRRCCGRRRRRAVGGGGGGGVRLGRGPADLSHVRRVLGDLGDLGGSQEAPEQGAEHAADEEGRDLEPVRPAGAAGAAAEERRGAAAARACPVRALAAVLPLGIQTEEPAGCRGRRRPRPS